MEVFRGQLPGGYSFSTPDEQRAFIKEMVKFGTNSEHIVSSEIENADFESYPTTSPSCCMRS